MFLIEFVKIRKIWCKIDLKCCDFVKKGVWKFFINFRKRKSFKNIEQNIVPGTNFEIVKEKECLIKIPKKLLLIHGVGCFDLGHFGICPRWSEHSTKGWNCKFNLQIIQRLKWKAFLKILINMQRCIDSLLFNFLLHLMFVILNLMVYTHAW